MILTLSACDGQDQSQPLVSTTPATRTETTAAPADVASPPPDAQITPSGLRTKVVTVGNGSEHPGDNDCVRIIFRAWRRDGKLFSTSGLGDETSTQCLRPAMPGVAEALKLMAAGEKRRIWVPANLSAAAVAHHGEKHFMKDPGSPLIDLTFDLQLVEILRAPPTPSDLRPPAQGVLKLRSGVWMQILKPGTGSSHPSVTSWLTLDYTGWTSDGKLFESTVLVKHPRLMLLGTALPGWQEALAGMVAGEKVRLWVPAALAYGEKPASKFLPAGDLIYDLEMPAFK
jgi:FKBP-type peptidyl-prolyl cis-trans isomerase